MSKRSIPALLILAFGASSAQASELFSVNATLNSGANAGQVGRAGFTTAEQALDSLDRTNLQAVINNYTGIEAATVNLDFRGLPVRLSYPNQGTSTLQLQVPELGINEVFNGRDRNASADQMRDYFKNGELLGQIMKRLAAVSPIDPIAGNPNSLMSRMAAQDFNTGFTDPIATTGPREEGAEPVNNLIGVDVRGSSFKQDGYKSTVLSLPLSYVVRNDLNPRRQMIFSMPLTQTDAEGAKSYQVGLGFAYRVPLTDNWALAPGVNYNIAGSQDLGSASQMASLSLTSHLAFDLGWGSVAMGNMIGSYKTLKTKVGDYSFDPQIRNTVLRNGFMFSLPTPIAGKRLSTELSAIDTRYSGTELYMKSYQEYGIALSTARSATSSRSFLRTGISLLQSSKSKGATVNFGYWF